MAQKWSSWVNKNVNRPVFVEAHIVRFKKRSEKNILSKSASFSSAARGPLRAAGRQTPSRARPPRRPGRLSGPDSQRRRLPQNEFPPIPSRNFILIQRASVGVSEYTDETHRDGSAQCCDEHSPENNSVEAASNR